MSRWAWAAWSGILALGAALRLWGLGTESFWQDEAWTWAIIRGSTGDLFHALVDHDAHPPLYFLLLQAWSWIFGTSEIALRLPSALLGIAALPLIHRMGRRLGDDPTGLLAMLLLALSPAHVYFSQEARSYTLLFLLCLASLVVLLEPPGKSPRKRLVTLALLTAGILYTHYMGVFFIIAQAAFVGVHRKDRPELLQTFLAAAIRAAVLFVPWLPIFIDQFFGRAGATWLEFPNLDTFLSQMGELVSRACQFGTKTDRWSLPLYAAALAIPLVTRRREHLALLLLLVVPVAVELLASLIRPVFYARTFMYVLVPLFLLAAFAIRRLPRAASIATGVLLAASFLPGLVQIHALDEKEDWRRVHALLETAAYREKIVMNPGYLDASALYYARHDLPGRWRHRLLLVDYDTIEKPAWPMNDARGIAARAPGIWLVTRYGQDDGWIEFLEKIFRRRLASRAGNVNVTYFSR